MIMLGFELKENKKIHLRYRQSGATQRVLSTIDE
jgi:hypothetical protein